VWHISSRKVIFAFRCVSGKIYLLFFASFFFWDFEFDFDFEYFPFGIANFA